MLFIVPDDSSEDLREKALLDTEELREVEPDESDFSDKVELDLDDAPFLDEEEDEEDEDEEQPERLTMEGGDEDDEAARRRKRKRIITISGVGVILLTVLVVILLRPWKEDPPPAELDVPPIATEEDVQTQPSAPPEPEPIEFIVSWEPFWVEHKTKDGEVRFLICKFSAPASNEKLSFEMRNKKVVLRDAIFYYLRNKDLTFLSDKNNVDVLKKDLLSVINQYLSQGQIEDLLIEEYLVK